MLSILKRNIGMELKFKENDFQSFEPIPYLNEYFNYSSDDYGGIGIENEQFLQFDEAKLYIQNANVVGADETSFNQGNIDGFNPEQRKAWLWVAVTPLVTFFEIALTRCTQQAKNLLGESFRGILNSDRHGAYNWVDLERRQLCWAC